MTIAQTVQQILQAHNLGRVFYTVPSGEFIVIPFSAEEDFVKVIQFETVLEASLPPGQVRGQLHEKGYYVKVLLK